MGRKIPGKKHKGVKNPIVQAAKRFASIAEKVDCPPEHPDEQKVPQRFLELMQLREAAEKKTKKKKKTKTSKLLSTLDFIPKEPHVSGAKRPIKPPEVITQRPGEPAFLFMKRVQESCERSMREAYFEDQFNVEVQRDPKTGEVTGVVKEKKYESDLIAEQSLADKNSKKKKKKYVKLSKKEKRNAKLLAKAQIKSEEIHVRDFSDLKDEVKFGEVVHRPPVFTALPKLKEKTISKDRKPGQRDLLLKSLLEGKDEKQNELSNKTKNKLSEAALARKKMLEEERNRVINLYRSMKNNQNKIG